MNPRLSTLALALLAWPHLGHGRARADEVPEARVEATAGLLVVARGGQARIVHEDGRPVARLGHPHDEPAAASSPGPLDPGQVGGRRERIFDLYAVPTELRDTTEADDLVDDELSLAERRALRASRGLAARGPTAGEAIAAAASARSLWLAASDALWVVRPGRGPLRLGPPPGAITALAATDAGLLVAIAGGAVLVSSDGGATWRSVGRVSTAAGPAAVLPGDGVVGWIDAGALTVAVGDGPPVRLSTSSPARDLRTCGATLVLLAEDGLYEVANPTDPTKGLPALARRTGPLPARRLTCRPDGRGPWLAVGPELLVSDDGGRTWRAHPDTAGAPILDAAVGETALWVVTAAGLVGLPLTPDSAGEVNAGPEAAEAAVRGIRRHPPLWARFLPRVTLQASYLARDEARELRALAFAELPLAGLLTRSGPVRGVRLVSDGALAGERGEVPGVPAVPVRRPYPADPDGACLAETRARAVAGALAEPERARSYVERARRAAWLPELRLRVERRLGRSESLDLASASAVAPLGLDTAHDVRYEARASWDLARLVFSSEELAAEAQALRMADMRREIESQVNRLYFERRRLLVELATVPEVDADDSKPGASARRLVRLEELAAELDALSAGTFSRCRQAHHEVPRP